MGSSSAYRSKRATVPEARVAPEGAKAGVTGKRPRDVEAVLRLKRQTIGLCKKVLGNDQGCPPSAKRAFEV